MALMEYEVHTDSGYIFEDISVQKFVKVEKFWIDTSIDGKNDGIIRIFTLG